MLRKFVDFTNCLIGNHAFGPWTQERQRGYTYIFQFRRNCTKCSGNQVVKDDYNERHVVDGKLVRKE